MGNDAFRYARAASSISDPPQRRYAVSFVIRRSGVHVRQPLLDQVIGALELAVDPRAVRRVVDRRSTMCSLMAADSVLWWYCSCRKSAAYAPRTKAFAKRSGRPVLLAQGGRCRAIPFAIRRTPRSTEVDTPIRAVVVDRLIPGPHIPLRRPYVGRTRAEPFKDLADDLLGQRPIVPVDLEVELVAAPVWLAPKTGRDARSRVRRSRDPRSPRPGPTMAIRGDRRMGSAPACRRVRAS